MLKKFLKNIEWSILVCVLILIAIGCIALYSSTQSTEFDELKKQLIWLAISIPIMVAIIAIDYELILKAVPIGYIIMFILLVLVLFTEPINGATSWFTIGSFSIQPAEFTKIFVIASLALAITKVQENGKEEISKLSKLFMCLLIVIVPVLLIIKQPDYGTAIAFVVATIFMLFVAGINNRQVKIDPSTQIAINDTNIKLNDKDDLPRFSNIEELRSALVESRQTNGLHFYSFEGFESTIQSTVTKGDVALNDSLSSDLMGSAESSTQDKFLTNDDYSTTNNQVANVDEADIVKTDGEYIYYVQNNKVYIIKADTLEELSNISLAEDKEERFYPREIFINNDKLVVLGTHYTYEYDKKELDDVYYDYAYSFSKSKAKALIYSIKDKKDLKLEREVALDGDYVQARMIGDNVYFISRKGIRYYKTMRDIEVLPIVYDSYVSSNDIVVDCKRIVHFPEVESNTYTLVGGFNINNDEGMSVETFLGAGETIYASEEHLYITHENFGESYYNRKTTIYKFDLDEGSIKLETKGEIDGYLNNQFSMDEHKGYLRLATTVYIDDEIRTEKKNARTGAISVEIDTQKITANNLYVLNEDLKQSVVFANKAAGYSVTKKYVMPSIPRLVDIE